MSPQLRIEKALLAHQRKNPAENYLDRYMVLKQRLLSVEYSQTMAGFPGGNDHGPSHILRVLEHLDGILGKTPLQSLDPYELFITMLSVLYHDVGLLKGRKEHAAASALLLKLETNDYIFDSLASWRKLVDQLPWRYFVIPFAMELGLFQRQPLDFYIGNLGSCWIVLAVEPRPHTKSS